MSDTNYIGAIIKILELPNKKTIKKNISVTRFRAQLSQVRKSQIVSIVVWGNLANDISRYYKVGDYLLVEGYLSIRNLSNLESSKLSLKRNQITVLKVYPFLLNTNQVDSKV